jgi:CRP-like cAMP-binding protein
MRAQQALIKIMYKNHTSCGTLTNESSTAVLGCSGSCNPFGGCRLVPQRPVNVVLRQLAQTDFDVFSEIVRELEPHPLERGAVLGTPRVVTDFTYFVESGIVALVASTRTGNSVEVALVGREGVAAVADALGDRPLPYGLVVQLSGLAYRAPKELIRKHILSCSALHELLMNYSQRVMHQLAQSAVCNRFHTSVQRLARWLLLTAERADTNRFELTHEFVAQMVGAPRPVVTESAAALRDKGVIDYRRGVLTIRNPKRLHKFACECFEAISQSSDDSTAAKPPGKPSLGRSSKHRA